MSKTKTTFYLINLSILAFFALSVGPRTARAAPSCLVNEWYCKGGDVKLPPVVCYQNNGNVLKCVPKPGTGNLTCPANTDSGQKDGNGKTGVNRTYPYFDYDTGTVVNVPPFSLGATSGVTPTPLATPTPLPINDPGIPCGWPVDYPYRTITNRCPNNECPQTATNCLFFTHTYDAVDIDGNLIPVFATMDGVATRYVAAITTTTTPNYGVYIRIDNAETGFSTLYAHLATEPGDKVGDVKTLGYVKKGQQLGNAVLDSTGFVSGPHLHYEVWQDGSRTCPNAFLDSCVNTPIVNSPQGLWQKIVTNLKNLLSPISPNYDFLPMPNEPNSHE